MNIHKVTTAPASSSIEPTIALDLELRCDYGRELLLDVLVRVITEDGRVLGVAQPRAIRGENWPLRAQDAGVSGVSDERSVKVSFLLPLTARQLDYVAKLRERNSKGDVVLRLDVEVSVLESVAVLSGIETTQRQGAGTGPLLLCYNPPSGKPFSTGTMNLWLISGRGFTRVSQARSSVVEL